MSDWTGNIEHGMVEDPERASLRSIERDEDFTVRYVNDNEDATCLSEHHGRIEPALDALRIRVFDLETMIYEMKEAAAEAARRPLRTTVTTTTNHRVFFSIPTRFVVIAVLTMVIMYALLRLVNEYIR